MKPTPSYEAALKEQGYTVFLAVGLKEHEGNAVRGDEYQIKVAASPTIKYVSQETFDELANTIRDALARLYRIPMDDLETQ